MFELDRWQAGCVIFDRGVATCAGARLHVRERRIPRFTPPTTLWLDPAVETSVFVVELVVDRTMAVAVSVAVRMRESDFARCIERSIFRAARFTRSTSPTACPAAACSRTLDRPSHPRIDAVVLRLLLSIYPVLLVETNTPPLSSSTSPTTPAAAVGTAPAEAEASESVVVMVVEMVAFLRKDIGSRKDADAIVGGDNINNIDDDDGELG